MNKKIPYQWRASFESWIISNGGDISRCKAGEYKSAPTECSWIAWVSATQSYKAKREEESSINDDRAYRLATVAAEEFIRCNGLTTGMADEFVFHGADLADEYFQDCVAHLKHIGECVVFERKKKQQFYLVTLLWSHWHE